MSGLVEDRQERRAVQKPMTGQRPCMSHQSPCLSCERRGKRELRKNKIGLFPRQFFRSSFSLQLMHSETKSKLHCSHCRPAPKKREENSTTTLLSSPPALSFFALPCPAARLLQKKLQRRRPTGEEGKGRNERSRERERKRLWSRQRICKWTCVRVHKRERRKTAPDVQSDSLSVGERAKGREVDDGREGGGFEEEEARKC
mmetsp:Transcript_53720/g.105054  ORF Transcript_53720/g.105054 Transcript_53720/m.105054 type:complete len:201 (-) Transcript_53720:2064-2666(-)